MDIETITWVFIGFSAAVYVGARHLAESKKVKHSPSAQMEVDPTRWRHDGSQPLKVRDGNRRIESEVFADECVLLESLR